MEADKEKLMKEGTAERQMSCGTGHSLANADASDVRFVGDGNEAGDRGGDCSIDESNESAAMTARKRILETTIIAQVKISHFSDHPSNMEGEVRGSNLHLLRRMGWGCVSFR
ncbi:hypothetical protein ACJRO7_012077, partial [Eucalyptus globulus]